MFIKINFLNKIMKKIYLGLLLAFMLAIVLVIALGSKPGEGDRAEIVSITGNTISDISGDKILVDLGNSFLEFEGYKPTGSHIGTFERIQAYVYIDKGKVVGVEGIAQVASVKTDSGAVDKHLQNDDFFNADLYPEIKFTSTDVDMKDNEITGILEFHGYSNEITFPIEFSDGKVSGEFYLDTTPFNFKFTGVNKEVRIKFNFSY
jgi:polyisoprenoid-binding protein YceI